MLITSESASTCRTKNHLLIPSSGQAIAFPTNAFIFIPETGEDKYLLVLMQRKLLFLRS